MYILTRLRRALFEPSREGIRPYTALRAVYLSWFIVFAALPSASHASLSPCTYSLAPSCTTAKWLWGCGVNPCPRAWRRPFYNGEIILCELAAVRAVRALVLYASEGRGISLSALDLQRRRRCYAARCTLPGIVSLSPSAILIAIAFSSLLLWHTYICIYTCPLCVPILA